MPEDKVINNKESKIAFQEIKSDIKDFQEINSSRHVIVKGVGSVGVFELIKNFIDKIS